MINPIGSGSGAEIYHAQKEKSKTSSTVTKDENGVLVDIGNKGPEDVTYKKPAAQKLSGEEIEKLWKESEKATSSLRQIVESLIKRQGKSIKDVLEGSETIEVDATARAEAQKLISEDGELGIKQVTENIINFAKAISNGDKTKIPELRDAIEKGFSAAAEVLGELPDISKKTHDAVMAELDKWEKEE